MGLFSRRWSYRVATVATPTRRQYQKYRDLILATPGLLAYYEYSELVSGLFALDSSPSAYHWDLVTGTPVLVTGRVGTGLRMSGATDEARAFFPDPAVDAPRFQGATLSVETWFRRNETGGGTGRFLQWNHAEAQWPFRVSIDPTPPTMDMAVDIESISGFGVEVYAEIPADTQWHHLAYTYRQSVESALYVDGTLVDSGPASLSLACVLDTSSSLLWDLGGVLLDETAIYDTVLTSAQVRERYDLGRAS